MSKNNLDHRSVAMKESAIKSSFSTFLDDTFDQGSSPDQNLIKANHEKDEGYQIDETFLEDFIGGILVFTDQQKLIYASEMACRILGRLKPPENSQSPIPNEIWHICQSLVRSRHLFPDQNWLIEFDIFTNPATTLHICCRWLNLDIINHPCLLLTIEDRQQALLDLVIEEAERYGLTPREKEVWLLQQSNYTYKQIAAELGITPNTVKKHMRSIYAKKKARQS